MTSAILTCLVSLTFIITLCESARILAVFPTPSVSHQVVFRPVTLELAKRGHEVVVITTDPIFVKGKKAPANFTEIDVHDMSYNIWNKGVVTTATESEDLTVQVKIAMKQIFEIFKKQMLSNDVQKVLRDDRKFDLLFIEACVRPALALSYVMKIPTIQFSSFGAIAQMFESVGAPTHVYLYPLTLRQKIRNLTIWEKLSEYYMNYQIEKIFNELEDSENRELKQIFGPDIPNIAELRNNVDLMFLNVYPLWDFNRPTPPNVIYLGGLHQNPPNKLSQELQSYLDTSINGVIYMSLGTNVVPASLPPETVKVFLKAFSTLPYNVLWKWDTDKLEGKPDNVKISKWFPQSDLLQHKNIKLFITQGGLQSTDEVLTAGVPVLGIPILWDQFYNTELYVHYKIGLKLDIKTMTVENLLKAINTLINDESYRENMIKLKKQMRDQPQTSLERAIWWTEYVLRHGGARHLRSSGANKSWAEYLELELVFAVLITFILSSIAVAIIVKLIVNSLCGSSNVKAKAA